MLPGICTVITDDPLAGAFPSVTVGGEKLAVTPVGRPVALSATAPVKLLPLSEPTSIVAVGLEPGPPCTVADGVVTANMLPNT